MNAYRKSLFFSLVLLPLTAGCGKKEEPKAVSAPPAAPAPRKATQVRVPEDVRRNWKAVVISVKNKATEKETAYTVPIGSELAVPDSQIVLKVEAFLPDFVREGTVLTSKSAEPNNPAAQVFVFENGKEIFKGWLFSLYPTTHAFQHPTYGFTLTDFIPQR